jgi:phospholipid/cholesterol/gamma-HCH transport system substrate-binding protein
MKIPHAALPLARTVVLLVFLGLCLGALGYLWTNSGGRIPLVSDRGYRVVVAFDDVDNLVNGSDVRQAGVKIGTVAATSVAGDRALVTLQLDRASAPLHAGVTVGVHNKSLIEETYLDVRDGTGPALADGTALPPAAGRPSVQVDDVLASLDAPTRENLGRLLRSSAVATAGRRDDIGRALAGLGAVGREGTDGLTALAAQSDDLRRLVSGGDRLVDALDTQQGRIAALVTDSERIFRATAGGRDDLADVVRKLPPLLAAARDADAGLTTLAGDLRPVAADLRAAAPDLSDALNRLPDTTRELRGLLPDLDGTLRAAPDTLDRVPALADDLDRFTPALGDDLRDVNPALHFLAPYRKDLAAFFTNFSASVGPDDGHDRIFRILFLFSEQTLNSPLNINIGPLDKRNSIPRPGTGATPNPHGDAEQAYPRVHRDPAPR